MWWFLLVIHPDFLKMIVYSWNGVTHITKAEKFKTRGRNGLLKYYYKFNNIISVYTLSKELIQGGIDLYSYIKSNLTLILYSTV